MKILHYVDENRLSWAVPWIQTLEALGSKGCENVVLCRPGGTLSLMVEEAGFPCFRFRPSLASVPVLCRGMKKILETVRPDLVHTRLSSASDIAGYWTRRMGLPLVSTVDKFAKGKYYRRADFIVAVSEAVASHCMGKGFPDVPVEVLPNSLDIARYRRASADGNGYPKRAGKDGNKAVILGAGRFVDWKGFDVLIRSAALVSRSRPVELWLAGTGPELERLEALAREEVAPVRFWGFVEDIRELMWASDIFVLPSRDPEPFGLVLLEAMACGLPVIATDRGGPLDMIEDGRNGWLVPPGDPDALSRTLTEALSDPDLARKGLESMRRAREFDFDTVADRQMKFYKEIMEGRGKAI